jgi:hypothetical protein
MATLHATLPDNATTNIVVGNVLTDTGVILKIVARRGSLNCIGTIRVVSPFTDYVHPTPVVNLNPVDCGMTITADYSGTDIRLIVAVDATSTDDVTFDYNLEKVTSLTKITSLVVYTAFWASLSTATVEDAAPTNIILTFTKPDTHLLASDFTVAGFTVSSISRDATNKILTLTLTTEVVYGDTPVVTFVRTSATQAVTNNVLAIMTLTATGDGSGVSTLAMAVSSNTTFTLTGAGRFYTDAAGTLNESTTWAITTGASRTIYIRLASGTSVIKIPNRALITQLGTTGSDGWTTPVNAPSVSVTIGRFTAMTVLRMTGASTLIGALPTGLGTLNLNGASIAWTYNGALPTGLGTLVLSGASIAWTYNGALPTALTYLWLSGASIAWTYNGALPTGLGTLVLSGTSIDYTGLIVAGTGNAAAWSMVNYRISKMSSPDMITLLTNLKNRVGNLPAAATIGDYADYASPPAGVLTAKADLITAKGCTVTFGV